MWKAVFRDHEIFIRTGGEVRFIRLSATLQRSVAAIILVALGAWLAFTLFMLVSQANDAWQQRDVAARAVAVERAEARVAAQQNRVENSVQSLGARQDYFDVLFKSMGSDDAATTATRAATATATAPSDPAMASEPTATAGDEIGALQAIGRRQQQLAASLTTMIDARSQRAEAALASVGIRAGSSANQGGPFIPATRRNIARNIAAPREATFQRLARAFGRMELLEQLVLSLPSTLPAEGMSISSGFGYRRDPFTGGAAMHSGVDFKGPHGSAIRAASSGRISFVGRQSGYGNTVEIDHGHGMMTRYAHMSGFVARVGQIVTPGTLIGRMGSTGRSTGTHLHFEVRVNGSAVNPRRFLEANPDVLEVQADLGQRARARIATR